jgi:DNA-directed RNA polymerase specialized sigma subunit
MAEKGGRTVTAKEYLMQYRESMERTAEIETHLHELKVEAIRLKDHEGQSVALDEAVAKYTDACDEYAHDLSRMEVLRSEIQGAIDSVPDKTLRSVLHWRYICGYTWEQVAVKMNYSYRRATQLHGTALQHITRILAQNQRTGAV